MMYQYTGTLSSQIYAWAGLTYDAVLDSYRVGISGTKWLWWRVVCYIIKCTLLVAARDYEEIRESGRWNRNTAEQAGKVNFAEFTSNGTR
jgi:hypothetical protein